eukprot:CAMPEP_0170563402 /NCGR_PEP_ID=MMETSP0211-20121228/66335_1 /TAXON_ID=311385 /ORGANISM="Pseudokeronopsis sp., Strain OXSARD2" /LENGTH=82 /DNA_ID=CAMNT_0010881577 /DNA_START=179 /DNA_END=427 /DNA_ORIENTATION=+
MNLSTPVPRQDKDFHRNCCVKCKKVESEDDASFQWDFKTTFQNIEVQLKESQLEPGDPEESVRKIFGPSFWTEKSKLKNIKA